MPAAAVQEAVKLLGDQESYYDGVQEKLRALASAWILATFGAVGWLSQDAQGVPAIPGDLAMWGIAAITLVSGVGLVVLWFLDQFVYQHFIRASVLVGLHLERMHPDAVAPIRTARTLGVGFRASRWLGWFYLLPATLFFAVSGALVTFESGFLFGGYRLPACLLAGAVIAAVIWGVVRAFANEHSVEATHLARVFDAEGDPGFSTWVAQVQAKNGELKKMSPWWRLW